MEPPHDDAPLEPRPPRVNDLVDLCRRLNAAGARYVVVRVGDEFVVDLMKAACGIDYREASKETVPVPIEGVPIPFATPRLLWRMKQTPRETDAVDRLFLRDLLKDELPPAS